MWSALDRFNPGQQGESTGIFVPMDIYEQDDQIMIRCSVPGVKPEDLDLTIDQGMLTITGETKNDYERKEGNRVFHREHTFGRFTRSVRLPEDVDENKVDANFENGILTLSIARTQQPEAKPKQIAIKQGSSTQTLGQTQTKDFAYADAGKGQNQENSGAKSGGSAAGSKKA